jgi:hypothetical protein
MPMRNLGSRARGVTMPVREMTKIVEHEIHAIVLCSRHHVSPKGRASSSNVQADGF